MSILTLHISTPEKLFFYGDVDTLIITSSDGEMGILPGHLPIVVALETAPIHMKIGNEWKDAAVSGGFAQIKNDQVIILVDTAKWPEDIEESRALEAKKRAEERLQAQLSEVEYLRSRVALQRALTRLTIVKNKH